jgi:hypothetical protein
VAPEDTLALVASGSAPEYVDALEPAAFVRGVKAAFPTAIENTTTNAAIPVQLVCEPDDGGCFIVTWTDYLLTVEAHGVMHHHLNTLIDIAHGVGAALYDPQTSVRYEG